MDDFVLNKLTQWDLSELIQTFKEQHIDREALYELDDQTIAELIPIVGTRLKFKKRLKLLLEEQNTTDPETSESSVQCKWEFDEEAVFAQVCPSTNKANDKGKRRLDLQGESSQGQSPARKRPREDIHGTYTEEVILSDVKDIMRCVHQKLPNQDDKLNKFLKNNINNLETDKREVVGVFGKTGAGKSSLINAVIGVKNLLPSGRIIACTSVMIKVEANMRNSKYEAEIEFIKKEEWKEELWTLFNFLGDNEDQEKDKDDQDSVEKLSVLYGEEWRNKSPENLMDKKYFREIPEFLHSKSKILTSDTAKELSAKCVKYTRSESKEEDDKDVKRWYWPLVKCVTVRVPNNRLLQHVTLVDLPGNGDRNKSRDRMWKEVVGSCSTVWIVTEINRAASETEPWEILKESCSLMGNGGECRQIHFICTKSDHFEDSDDQSAAGVRAQILKQNKQAKKQVKAEFSKLKEVKNQFGEDCFKVFTVSSKEFLKKKRLDPDETEIPTLQEFLQDLNEWHSETLNYVSGARGILSLIQGASSREGFQANIKTAVSIELEEKLSLELDKVREPMKETLMAFEKCLSEGVDKSKSSCEKVLKSVLYPTKKGGFHKILKCVVENGGIHKTKKGKSININTKLTSCLTDSIDEEFKKTFPNERNSGPFNRVINTFSLGTEKLMNKECENVKLQLTFLKTEEEKMKTKLNKLIRERKKTIYSSLTTTIEETMKECYDGAKEIRGEGSLEKMRETIAKHVHVSKNVMFAQAKDAMMKQLRDLMLEILEKLESTMQESIELSLKTDGDSIPDVSVELEMVNKYYNELTECPDDDAILCDSPGQAAALRP
ncbi:nuclear GTPase SLIP-GC-like isoform X3 [Trematomus bernacchii]|uniref:nuclear GTPase SLIP-GC-like isoform X3 n=2 Tax=Trematomus bernacchii TaxID=40690 RepID=UPI00146F2693|nr:nuclear GTPase SLIP-GC-like isoform X3 [Trematomus bernacchii]